MSRYSQAIGLQCEKKLPFNIEYGPSNLPQQNLPTASYYMAPARSGDICAYGA